MKLILQVRDLSVDPQVDEITFGLVVDQVSPWPLQIRSESWIMSLYGAQATCAGMDSVWHLCG